MKYNFDLLPDRRHSESAKWHHYPEDVLPMWVADMDVISPEPVIQALRQRVDHGVFGYPSGASQALQQAILEKLENLYRWNVAAEHLVFIPGVVTGLNITGQAVGKEDEGVLIQTPVYPPFFGVSRYFNGNIQEAQLYFDSEHNRYEVDWQVFEDAITPQTRLFILCNPHNPVGRVFSKVELTKMAEICLKHDLFICSDEIHCDLVFSGSQHIPIASLDPEISQKTVTLIAPSKTFNLAGLECSIAIIPNDSLRRRFQEARRGLVGFVNLMGLVAAEAAYLEGQEWLDQLLEYLEVNRDFTYEYIKNEMPGIHMSNPEGTYLAWLDCRQAGIEGNPHEFFLEKARVAVNDGATFGKPGEGFVRLNFGCPRSQVAAALVRMKESLLNCT
jgi:cystathionine beta-lyase